MFANWRNKLSLNNVRLRNKMLIVYFLSVFVPVILTNVIFYDITTSNVKKQKMRDISLAIEQVRNDLAAQFDTMAGISAVLYSDTLLNQYLDLHYDLAADYVENYNSYISRTLEKYSPVYQAIQAITLYTENDSIIYGGHILPITDQLRGTSWYKYMVNQPTAGILVDKIAPDYPGIPESVFSFVREVRDTSVANSPRKFMKIDVSYGLIQQIMSDVTLEGDMYLLDGDRIMFTTNPDIDLSKENRYSDVSLPNNTLLMDYNLGSQSESAGSQSYLKEWRLVGAFQERFVLHEVRKSKEFVLYMAIPNLVIPTLVIIWFTRSLNVRLIRILKQVKRVKNHSFETIVQQPSKDEVGQLAEEFNRMTLQVKSLIDDVYVADIQKKSLELERRKAQFNALQSQINPHFLFNALETIRMRSLIKNETETSKIIHNMAKIFRTSLTWNKDRVTISEEMEFIVCFLEIQKYRFEDRLNYHLNIDPAAQRCLVPKMMFLPFVENACIHGIELLKSGGRIEVVIERQKDELLFEIRDNGIGMDEEKVKRFYSYLESEEVIGERIGVQNVIYRLKLIYGDKFRLLIESAPGQGTYISLRIPVE
ncbi:sensor histidine kinase [Cohnella yongneupensis]|uniref:Sensor histidine kinase n=1 Tax=Cohnella yongneupensis TaxID=425006 RepID=A0ABW0R2M6_9BACL